MEVLTNTTVLSDPGVMNLRETEEEEETTPTPEQTQDFSRVSLDFSDMHTLYCLNVLIQ